MRFKLYSITLNLILIHPQIHNNGRLLDTYHRLHGAEDDFLVPYDQEISAKELTYICRKGKSLFQKSQLDIMFRLYI